MIGMVLSFPHARHLQTASFVPPSQAVFNQVLLGAQGQLHALIPHFERLTPNVFICSVPEIVLTPQSFEPLLSAIGRKSIKENEIVHMRFGPVRYACVMKGTRNKAVIAEHESRDIYSASMSPFAVGDVLPAAFSEAFLLLDRPRGLRRPDGRQLPEHVLGSGVGISSARSPQTGGIRAPDQTSLAFLDIVSAGDFDAGLWESRRAKGTILSAPQGFLDLIERDPAGSVRPLPILVPWNMSDPGGFAPNLLERFLDEADPLKSGPALALMPFNETFETPAALNAAIARIRRHPQAEALLERGVFLVGVASAEAFPAFASLFSCFVLDAGDPEFAWSFRRLCSLGLRPAVFGAESLAEIGLEPDSPLQIDFFPFELSEVVYHSSAYGAVHLEAGRISRRQYRALQEALREGAVARDGSLSSISASRPAINPDLALHRALQEA